jgi:hypothetical protein
VWHCKYQTQAQYVEIGVSFGAKGRSASNSKGGSSSNGSRSSSKRDDGRNEKNHH